MRLYNADEAESDRRRQWEDPELDDEAEDACCTFFDLRQRTLVGLDPTSAFRIVALGLLRKLRTNSRGTVLYGEIEDALGRYFRLLDADMQRFATLHEALREPADKALGAEGCKEAAAAAQAAQSLLHSGMREIAGVLLACGEMQKRALDLKMGAQRSISDARSSAVPLVSFGKFSQFLEEALAVCDQLRRKHEELQQIRLKAMASAMDAKMAAAAAAAAQSGAGKKPTATVLGMASSPNSSPSASPTRREQPADAAFQEAKRAAEHL